MKSEYSAQHQTRIIELAGVPESVAGALNCWVDWMHRSAGVAGYPKASIGFKTGGINCFDDLDDRASSYAARAVDGSMESLDSDQRSCIGHIWLDNVMPNRNIDVDKIAAEAVRIIYHGLQLRGAA